MNFHVKATKEPACADGLWDGEGNGLTCDNGLNAHAYRTFSKIIVSVPLFGYVFQFLFHCEFDFEFDDEFEFQFRASLTSSLIASLVDFHFEFNYEFEFLFHLRTSSNVDGLTKAHGVSARKEKEVGCNSNLGYVTTAFLVWTSEKGTAKESVQSRPYRNPIINLAAESIDSSPHGQHLAVVTARKTSDITTNYRSRITQGIFFEFCRIVLLVLRTNRLPSKPKCNSSIFEDPGRRGPRVMVEPGNWSLPIPLIWMSYK
ncbi:unnamed protein product [Nesidiocoris tenuis]|uniref:Uncharacterized protein n=1 Tax=Nesidiocoris tenuis TaxID=355587 RepID=A0A6H5H6L8_9HEMI|nr:unnamed protein product [Nesidiocoris tenuis]